MTMSDSDFLSSEFGMSPSEGNQISQASASGGAPQGQGGGYNNNNGNSYGGYNTNNNQGGNNDRNNQYGGNYSKNNNGGGSNYGGGNSGNGYRKGGGGNGGFKRKPDEVKPAYLPVVIHIEDQFPDNIKEDLFKLAGELVNRGYFIRYNCEDPDLHARYQALSQQKTEGYVPWKGFNGLETKFYFNTMTANALAEESNPAWEKLPNIVKAKLARNVRLMFGQNNNSPAMALITWSPDGVTKKEEVTRETGYVGSMIQLADRYRFDVYNIGNGESKQLMFNRFLQG